MPSAWAYRAKAVATAEGNFTQGVYKDSTYVKLYAKPKFHLRDTTLCKGQVLLLDAKMLACAMPGTRMKAHKRSSRKFGQLLGKDREQRLFGGRYGKSKILQNAIVSFNSEVTFCLNEENKTLSVRPARAVRFYGIRDPVRPRSWPPGKALIG